MSTLSNTLIVPVDLAALCVGNTDVNGSVQSPYGTKDFSRLAPDFSLLPYAADGTAHNQGPYISNQVVAESFQPVSDPLDVGIHLHWALPDAIAHGAQAEDNGSIEFPPAPNRWLVVRIATNSADSEQPTSDLKAWVIESDRLWDKSGDSVPLNKQNRKSLDVPIQPNPSTENNKSSKTMGCAFPFDTWSEDPGAERGSLTALGFGEPTYAAAYEFCPNVFGFWDTLEDLDPTDYPPDSTRISYMLSGWHADASEDPMIRISYTAEADHAQKTAHIKALYKWVFDDDGSKDVPTRTLYNALMTGITWNEDTHYIEQKNPGPDLEIAVGNTTVEALSALLAAQPDLASLPNVETILNALQLGLLSRTSLPGGLADMDEALHQNGFASSNHGTIWNVKTKSAGMEDNVVITDESIAAAASNKLDRLPPEIGNALNTLNASQQALDEAALVISSLRARIFADWYRYMKIEYAQLPPANVEISSNEAMEFIQSELSLLNDKINDLATLQAQLEQNRQTLNGLIGDDYVLLPTASARYWNPNDPVVLFSGEDVKPPYRYNPVDACDSDGNLICRLSSNIISAMMFNGGAFTLEAANLPGLPTSSALVFVGPLQALLGEAFFIDTNQACLLAAGIAALGGDDNPALSNLSAFTEAVKAAQHNLFADASASSDIAFTGLVPSFASFKQWRAPWIPIIMQWQTTHYPNVLPPYAEDVITSQYGLDADDIDLTFKGTIPVDRSNARTYQGTIVLTHNTEINIKQQISNYIANFPDDDRDGELQQMLDEISLSMQAQALSGFNQDFLMLDRVLQMEVSDPLAILKGLFFSNFTNKKVNQAVGGENIDSPKENNTFCPLRNGAMELSRLRVIDAFGQVIDIEKPAVIRAAALKTASDPSGLISLPPRITQPSRLLFRWLSAQDDQVEVNSHPATTPVCGWVLFNHLDESLVIYDTHGNALGSFNQHGQFWQGAPGNQDTYNKDIEEVFANANPHLRNFALGMNASADPAGYLGEMLQVINDSVTGISPTNYKEQKNLSVLIGRPLALVRASLYLDLMGLPSMNQNKDAFKAAIDGGDPSVRDEGGLPQLKVPVRLGDLSDINDGMIGYFIDDGAKTAYRTFYAPAATSSDRHGVVEPAFDQIVVTADPAAPPVLICMLMDPHASVHATTGVLPMKELTIPPAIITDDLDAMTVTFLTTPVLNSGEASMPVPDESGYIWNWVTEEHGVGQWTINPISAAGPSGPITLLPQQASEGWLKLQPNPKPKKEN
ncbi:hypothetical protein DO021_16575 [Desulfobacter hydrogenophilus]|uniref:Uncharacterized protein n=1 Tax=Desulfobacter hydrogenophilus TaxID=2291 RepID=A0A328F932_9BACT|nr:hypothetical protein [Desulfobacter hydrogenophilus]NDY73031.1 hypothetical protein [Desulfobacter hydrogenophilus]QBH14716.1 hypothetical protein EYB58_18410 [Desulfobacter hydrogenophilus]RAM00879.1 hypothetical protein DO021_16575 [Desulfobacter hydrogenophilus]